MFYAIRVADIPKFIIGFLIAIVLLGGLISLWKATGGMPDWIVYSLLCAIVIVSILSAHFIWKWFYALRRKH
jgi:hypothetical protein